ELHNAASSADLSFDFAFDGIVQGNGALTGGVPLHPGVNRVTVQAFDGLSGAGKEVGRTFLDIWNTSNSNGSFNGSTAEIDDLALTVPDNYRPGVPFLVQVQALKNG